MKNNGPQDTAPIVVVYTRACDGCGSADVAPDEYACASCKARIAARRLARIAAELNSATTIASNPTRAGWGL